MRALAACVVAAVLVVTAPFALAQTAGQQEKPKEAAAADAITGDWDGTVMLQNGEFPFNMKLKLENDKVTGDIGSDQGSVPVSGTYAEGKLTLSFTYVNGEPIAMKGDLKDGQLSGMMDIGSGQMMTTWSAKKKA